MRGMGREESADFVREMYSSRLGLDAGGGIQSDLPLNGCWGGGGLLPKKCLTLRGEIW